MNVDMDLYQGLTCVSFGGGNQYVLISSIFPDILLGKGEVQHKKYKKIQLGWQGDLPNLSMQLKKTTGFCFYSLF